MIEYLNPMRKLILYILLGILSLYLCAEIIPGISFAGPIKNLFLAGVTLGLLNYLLKPILQFFLFPLNLLTFGLIGLVINIGFVFFVICYLFNENFSVGGILPLILATILTSFIYTFFFHLTKSFKYE
ncbi:MAG: phage holin family protein [Candidatus Pacebacteria bacterium]|nr:phage holin family protein [Candidatus Paceibacterota bacterium]